MKVRRVSSESSVSSTLSLGEFEDNGAKRQRGHLLLDHPSLSLLLVLYVFSLITDTGTPGLFSEKA